MNISDKVLNIDKVKSDIKTQLNRTSQNINVKFRDLSTLIENIPNTNQMEQEDIDNDVEQLIEINGENA